MRAFGRAFAVISVGLALSGCAVLNTGEVDYRRAGIAPVKPSSQCSPSFAKRLEECPPLGVLDLVLKNYPTGRPISASQAYSVSIDHGVIADMVEPKFALRRAVQLKNPIHRIGEIVILAHVFEFPEASATASAGFLQFANFGAAKVVYYNPDVQEHQDMSFSNIPVVPPTRYNGRPVGLQFVVLELDRVSPPMKALLEKLAALGQSSGMIPGGAVSQTLLELGTSMITRNNDDVIFEYRFVLDPASSTARTVSPTFEEGRYVLRRQEERDQAAVWRNIVVDENTGELKELKNDGQSNTYGPFTQSTYLTLNIKRHDDSAVSTAGMPTLDELNQVLTSAASAQGEGYTQAAAVLQGQLDRSAEANRYQRLLRSWKAVEGAGIHYAGSVTTSDQLAKDQGCANRADYRRAFQLGEVALRSAIADFRGHWGQAIGTVPKVSEENQRRLMLQVAAYLAPAADPLTTEVMSDPVLFAQAVSDPSMTFSKGIVTTIRTNRGLSKCPAP